MYLVELEKKKKEKKVHYSKEQTYFIYIARRSSTYSLNQSKTKPENLEEKYLNKKNESNWTHDRKGEKSHLKRPARIGAPMHV